MEPTTVAQPLDDYLREVVQTLHAAVTQGMRHATDNGAARQIHDCQEILSDIMAGDVKEWLAPGTL